MEVVARMTTVRKGSADDPRSLAMRITSLERQLGMDPETHLIDPLIGATSYGRWSLFEDSNGTAFTGVDSTDTLAALMPVFTYIGTRGQWVAWFTVRATVTGSGVARCRLYDYIASAFVTECEWLFYFNATTTTVLTMNGHHSLKSLSGSQRLGLVIDRESGTGTYDVGVDDAKLSVLVVGQTGSSSEPAPGSESFSYTGAAQYFTVPANVFEVTVTAKGGAGGKYNDGVGGGARGGLIKCSVPVVPGQVLQVNVGGGGKAVPSGTPSYAGGWNGGGAGSSDGSNYAGGGGGMTDLRLYPYAVTDALLVAGGGGGGKAATGGLGGLTATAGAGGALGGGPGTSGSGGAGGTGTLNGVAGTQGQGGDSAGYGNSCYPGGGGGGWYGGGGGANPLAGVTQGDGGGGSSYYDTGSGVVLVSETAGGGDAGDGSMLIEW